MGLPTNMLPTEQWFPQGTYSPNLDSPPQLVKGTSNPAQSVWATKILQLAYTNGTRALLSNLARPKADFKSAFSGDIRQVVFSLMEALFKAWNSRTSVLLPEQQPSAVKFQKSLKSLDSNTDEVIYTVRFKVLPKQGHIHSVIPESDPNPAPDSSISTKNMYGKPFVQPINPGDLEPYDTAPNKFLGHNCNLYKEI